MACDFVIKDFIQGSISISNVCKSLHANIQKINFPLFSASAVQAGMCSIVPNNYLAHEDVMAFDINGGPVTDVTADIVNNFAALP